MLLKRVEMLNSFVTILILFPFVRCIHASGCNKTGSKLTCTNLNLSGKNNIPANNEQNIREIECVDCTIPLVSSGMFRNFADAKMLALHINQIQTIEPGAFSGMNNLEYLYLHGNSISNLQFGAITSLKNLHTLYLLENRLTKIDKNYFANLTHLTDLNLASNLIEIITDDAFEGLISLRTLTLYRNRIKSLPAGCFKDLRNLQSLYMDENLLSTFENGVFDGLNTLNLLYISNNSLEFINECSFSPLGELRQLLIHDNKLTYLNVNKLLKALPKLNYIDLNNNQWYCNALSDMLPKFIKRGIPLEDNDLTNINVFGIACLNKTIPDSIRNEMASEDCVIVNNVTDNNIINTTTPPNSSPAILNSTETAPNSIDNVSAPGNSVILSNKTDNNVDEDFIEIIYNTILTTTNKESPCTTPNGEAATCKELSDCDILLQVAASKDSSVKRFLRASGCGPFMVCCGTSSNFTATEIKPINNVSVQNVNTTSLTKEEKRKYLLPHNLDCGLQHYDDYVPEDITRTSMHEFPWLLYISLYKQQNQGFEGIYELRCVGVLINKRYALTASECNAINFDSVQIGQHDRFRNSSCEIFEGMNYCSHTVQSYAVEENIVHENGILLIRLAKTITLSNFIEPICLPFEETRKLKVGDALFSSGWGDVTLEVENVKAKKRIKHVVRNPLSEDLLYVNSTNYIDCFGDEGGPLMHRIGATWFLDAIIPPHFCLKNVPARRLNQKVIDWIIENIRP